MHLPGDVVEVDRRPQDEAVCPGNPVEDRGTVVLYSKSPTAMPPHERLLQQGLGIPPFLGLPLIPLTVIRLLSRRSSLSGYDGSPISGPVPGPSLHLRTSVSLSSRRSVPWHIRDGQDCHPFRCPVAARMIWVAPPLTPWWSGRLSSPSPTESCRESPRDPF